MSTPGVVRAWWTEEGWGVIDSPATPGGCWAHFSQVLVAGNPTLTEGQHVTFEFVAAAQDGYDFRAVEVWPADQAPDRSSHESFGPSDAYGSSLTVTFSQPDGPQRG